MKEDVTFQLLKALLRAQSKTHNAVINIQKRLSRLEKDSKILAKAVPAKSQKLSSIIFKRKSCVVQCSARIEEATDLVESSEAPPEMSRTRGNTVAIPGTLILDQLKSEAHYFAFKYWLQMQLRLPALQFSAPNNAGSPVSASIDILPTSVNSIDTVPPIPLSLNSPANETSSQQTIRPLYITPSPSHQHKAPSIHPQIPTQSFSNPPSNPTPSFPHQSNVPPCPSHLSINSFLNPPMRQNLAIGQRFYKLVTRAPQNSPIMPKRKRVNFNLEEQVLGPDEGHISLSECQAAYNLALAQALASVKQPTPNPSLEPHAGPAPPKCDVGDYYGNQIPSVSMEPNQRKKVGRAQRVFSSF
ncbi:hypothetical protein BDR26DRAFT_1002388 [Obelidium mucronatum]|nr:hypothetical protein BDR26DRAFT_1002388 [Obelidium mucronatum]